MTHTRALAGLLLSASLLPATAAQEARQQAEQEERQAPLVQPGAPGEAARTLDAEEAARVADTRYSAADIRFMQMMIPHHHQAVVMAQMAPERTNDEAVLTAAGRILAAQEDEIAFMREWLEARGEDAPDPAEAERHAAMGHSGHSMSHGGRVDDDDRKAMGMATDAELDALEASEGTAFDRQFLSLMIPHHVGALDMVDALRDQPGSAYDPALYAFIGDVEADQRAEIRRMNDLLAGLSDDPRVGLAPGLRDAGEAISNLTLVASLERPRGFSDPDNPLGLLEETEEGADGETKTTYARRSPALSFWNTDMAFADDVLVAGSYHGFNVYRLGEDGAPTLVSSVVCPGGQGDVSIVGDLLLMSVEETRGRTDCGLSGVDEAASAERFRGLRIFDISDLTAPVQVGQVQTCRGSHTHSVVAADRRRIVVYNSGTSGVRSDEELPGCTTGTPGEQDTALFSIDVIEIPVADPGRARITSSPRVFADDATGRIAGLWDGGDHGEGTQATRRTDQCHDITVYPEKNLAAGACSGNGILLDISDPLNPRRIDAVTDTGFAYWHSATFNNDGTKVLFTDEWGGGTRPRCQASDPLTWGADAIYEIEDGELRFASYYKMPAPQSEIENCVAHNGSVVPVPGRDVFAQAWYQGGLSVMDFTDTEAPVEIAYFDRGPVHPTERIVGGYWSTYYYDGHIYGTEIVRGLDVLALTPSEHLTENEIRAATLAEMPKAANGAFNPQQQFAVTWPDAPVVALAYLDQLERDGTAPAEAAALRDMLMDADDLIADGETDRELSRDLRRMARAVGKNADGKRAMLADTLEGVAKSL